MVSGFSGEEIGDGGKNGGIAEVLSLMQGSKALEIDPRTVGVEPVENFHRTSGCRGGRCGWRREAAPRGRLSTDHRCGCAPPLPRRTIAAKENQEAAEADFP